MIHPTPEMLRACYELLRTTLPFRNWKLPHANTIKFVVDRSRAARGQYWREDKTHCISISAHNNGYLSSMVPVMAHEMIHLYQGLTKTETAGVQHNAGFWRLTDRVCQQHGFDPKAF